MTLEKFNSTLVINQKISSQIADFELVNSELRENGAAIRLNYREIKSKKTKKWQINEFMHRSIDYYKNQLKNIPDCKLKKDDIQNKIILNEFNSCFLTLLSLSKREMGEIFLTQLIWK